MDMFDMFLWTDDERKVLELLNRMNPDNAKKVISCYIQDKKLHSEYIELITKISKDYIEKSNSFIVQIKRDANFFWQGEAFGKNILKNVDIDEKNWFWYARLLRDTEDEVYPSSNFLTPKYILNRLKPIVANLNPEELRKDDIDRYNLYKILLKLYDKYGIILEE